ncbi:Uncharacterised protein g3306 [Pycnogonum litorale]
MRPSLRARLHAGKDEYFPVCVDKTEGFFFKGSALNAVNANRINNLNSLANTINSLAALVNACETCVLGQCANVATNAVCNAAATAAGAACNTVCVNYAANRARYIALRQQYNALSLGRK